MVALRLSVERLERAFGFALGKDFGPLQLPSREVVGVAPTFLAAIDLDAATSMPDEGLAAFGTSGH